MEYALPELLSRDDILRILSERHLQLYNMNELTHGELLRVYKTFAMPLSQRPERSKRIKNHAASSTDNGDDHGEEMQVESVDTVTDSMDIDYTNLAAYNDDNFGRNLRTKSPTGEKRRQRSCDNNDDEDIGVIENDYQYQLCSVTKRIRMNNLS